MPTITDMVAYDLSPMTGEIAAVLGRRDITDSQRKKIDKIIYKYARRQVKIVADHV